MDETDSHRLHERGEDVVTVHEPNGDTIAMMEIESVCDVAGLMPPALDQFWGD